MSITSQTIDLFKVVVAPKGALNLTNALDGFVTDFVPTPTELKVLKEKFAALPVTTLFSVEERKTASLEHLITKQILHYIEVYGLDAPGLFNLEVSSGRIATLTFIKAVTVEELTELALGLAYANRPIADVKPLLEIIKEFGIKYDINQAKNNELRVMLFDPSRDVFKNGDDAVRWICYKATGDPLLIKSKKAIDLTGTTEIGDWFFSRHLLPLAQVFNRHKAILLACKHPHTASTINKISKLSKKNHVPVHESIAKTFIAKYLNGTVSDTVLSAVSLRDKFKYLNLIEYKLLGLPYDSFNIRNGKIWFELNRPHLSTKGLMALRHEVVNSIEDSLVHLSSERILLDPFVDYGLPISRKQTIGNLPFGTRVTPGKSKLSAGIYWHNSYGADQPSWGYSGSIDLDLSAINDKGSRVGWGQWSGYTDKSCVFSGDVTSAPHGATEFMEVSTDKPNRYGLMVNIFHGPEKCDVEIVVGTPNDKQWLEGTVIRERMTMQSKQNLVGILNGDSFIIYAGRLNESRVSAGMHPVLDKGFCPMWTVKNLLNSIGVKYDTEPVKDMVYAHDLRYMGFTQDKLETMLGV